MTLPALIKRRAFYATLIGCSFCALTYGAVGSAQQPSPVSAIVQASVSTAGDVVTYSYSITNSGGGPIWAFDVDATMPVGGVALSSDGLIGDPISDAITAAVASDSRAVPIVPLSVKSPFGWTGGPSVRGTAGWAADDETSLIQPSKTVSGFQLTSRGLPVVRSAILQPYADVNTLPIPPPTGTDDLKRYVDQVNAFKASVSFKVLTIGPSAPPADFKAADFLNTIINTKEQAVQQGWIRDQGIGISLDAKLNAAKASLARGNNHAATNELNALLHEVNAQGGKQLSSEAVALLTFNTQYLISKIQ
jgi:hypothetical protein